MESFFDYCKNFILDEMPERIGQDFYGADFGYSLTEGMRCDGTFTYSTEKAKDYIREWWQDCSEYSEYEKDNFDYRSNPFENPEKFLVSMVSEGVSSLLSRSKFIEKKWNDMFTLTRANMKTIRRQVGSITERDLPDESLF